MIQPNHHVILVIEDDETLRLTLSEMLELNGYRTLTAPDGTAGLAMAQRERPSLIITDVSMPGLSGFELLSAFRQDPELRSVPVIVVSAKVARADTRHGMDLGADDYITKPFAEAEVLRSVAARLEKKELLEELDAFAHTVAHDLRGPISLLNGRLYLAGMMLGKADFEQTQKQIDEALAATARLNRIIEELLLLSGVRRGNATSEPLDMAAIVTEAMAQLETVFKEHPAKVQVPDAWPVALGHGPWVVHLWVNYIGNAAKYAGPNAEITLGAEPAAEGRAVRFWVQDRGAGLDAEACSRLFVPFTRISSVRVKGHGLGLSIVRRVAEKLGGEAGVESVPRQGSRFWFTLPNAQGAAKPKVLS